ncbi:MAG: serine hydrolase domain-containing protein, partial [Paracoccaceae bacterium]
MFDHNRLNRIETWMDAYVADRKFAGCSVLIQSDRAEIFHKASGLRNLAASTPFQRDTIVRLYSMTKPVTSMVLMMLVEEGLVHLDAPLDAFIPEFKDTRALIP